MPLSDGRRWRLCGGLVRDVGCRCILPPEKQIPHRARICGCLEHIAKSLVVEHGGRGAQEL